MSSFGRFSVYDYGWRAKMSDGPIPIARGIDALRVNIRLKGFSREVSLCHFKSDRHLGFAGFGHGNDGLRLGADARQEEEAVGINRFRERIYHLQRLD